MVQFRDDFWGRDFIHIPECKPLRQLFAAAQQGLKITGQSKERLQLIVNALEFADSFRRVLLLGECLELLSTTKDYLAVSTQGNKSIQPKGQSSLDKVVQFTIDNFKEAISLTQMAGIACMSIPAFCNYFKRSTKKTYIDFLNEIRVGYACQLLLETQKPVLTICYESGYNTMANFHKQFLKIKKLTPLQYRKHFDVDIMQRGNNIGIES